MIRPLPRFLLASSGSGCGKTTLTCGILRALQDRGIRCTAYKCGPDYIDPMFHRHVLGVSGGNLDTWLEGEERVRGRLAAQPTDVDCTVIEGVMGYYDGLGGIRDLASAYDVARATDTPVILILDARGKSLSLAAELKGFLAYREDSRIRGVILNRISAGMADRLRPAIQELGVNLVGSVPELEAARLESRHLGLVPPGELDSLREQIGDLANRLEETVRLDRLLEIAGSAPRLEIGPTSRKAPGRSQTERAVRIGVARDEAFCFYYQENLELLEELGAELVYFSPVYDSSLPGRLDGLLLGGGYPELWGAQLERNRLMREQVGRLVRAGLPVLAECGGFLYLHEGMEGADGREYRMAGAIRGRAFRTDRLARFGYVELAGRKSSELLKGGRIRGHEFHYWDSENNGEDWEARKPVGDWAWSCVHERGGLVAGFPHLYYPSNPEFISRWVGLCRDWRP